VPHVFIIILLSISPWIALGQEEYQQDFAPAPMQELVKAQVLTVERQETKNVPGTDVQSTYQTLTARILEGAQKDRIVTVENDFLTLNIHEIFYLMHTVDERGDTYAVKEPYRLNSLLFFCGLFLLVVFVFGGIQGLRGLLSLAGGMVLIMLVLLPGITHGFSPVLVATAVASAIVLVALM
jgi:uncharacterized membrane protein